MNRRDTLTTYASLFVLIGPFVIAAVIYVGGYFVLGDVRESEGAIVRSFRAEWLVTIYQPAAVVEANLLDCPIALEARD
jgi:hypothetical protein